MQRGMLVANALDFEFAVGLHERNPVRDRHRERALGSGDRQLIADLNLDATRHRNRLFTNSRHSSNPSSVHPAQDFRSEEHTSELQSRGHLVCRLLLEKKKTAREIGERLGAHYLLSGTLRRADSSARLATELVVSAFFF